MHAGLISSRRDTFAHAAHGRSQEWILLVWHEARLAGRDSGHPLLEQDTILARLPTSCIAEGQPKAHQDGNTAYCDTPLVSKQVRPGADTR